MINLVKPMLGKEEQLLVEEVLSSGELAQGRYVEQFEKQFTAFNGVSFGVATSSGTTALHAALLSLGIKPGDKVITTPFSFVATANAILYSQAIPVFCDIDMNNYNLSPEALIDTLKEHPDAKAIIVVHLYGHPANMPEIIKIAQMYGLKVIEDCAQAHGASINGQKVGSFGDCGAFSFYPTKNMTCGEGGILVTQDKVVADQARIFVNHGQSIKYQHDVLGYNYRMTNIHAAIGIAQLGKLDEFNKKRQQNALRYSTEITNPAVIKPICLPGFEHVYHQYTVQVNDRNRFMEFLKNKGIACGIHYPKTIPDQPLYQQQHKILGNFPNARIAADKVVSIPVYPGLRKEEVDYIVESLQTYSDD